MLREVIVYPNPILRIVSTPVEVIDDDLRALATDMTDTMYEESGVGIAASQIGINKRVIAIDVSSKHNQPQVYINPEIVSRKGKILGEEGCLSVPGLRGDVERAEQVVVVAQLLDGSEVEITAEGMAARAFQHEIDHLNGILFIDKLDSAEKFRLRDEISFLEETYNCGDQD